MKNLGCFRTQSIQPLTVPTDFRASEGGPSSIALEVSLNVDADNARDRPRLGGWRKLLASTPFCYQNQDLHDQLVGCQFYHTSSLYERDSYTVVSGSAYPYFIPTQIFADQTTTRLYQLFAGPGVYPEMLNDGTYENAAGYLNYGLFEFNGTVNEYHMGGFAFNGWPDEVAQLTVDQVAYLMDDQFFYDEPNYYMYDYFHGIYREFTEGYTIEGYAYGDPIDVSSRFPAYSYTLCSDELYYQPGCREPITLLKEVSTTRGVRQLIAGTKSRLYVNDARGGNWRIIADRLGGSYGSDNCSCDPVRWRTAQVGNIVLFVNGVDPVMAWDVNDGPSGCFYWSADYVLDLLALEIESAAAVGAWNGFAFIGNAVINGQRFESRLYWSDFNDPRSWAPGLESTAGYHDFGRGERIMEIQPIGGRIRVYTNRAIYDGTLVGGDLVFHFSEIYRGPNLIAYPNSFVDTGSAHFYLGEDSLWMTEEHSGPPIQVEWLDLAAGAIFDGLSADRLGSFDYLDPFGPINEGACEQAVGGYDPERETLWFSWATDDNVCPNMSIIFNMRFGTSSLVDHGFTAFASYEPDFRQTIRDWIAENGICDATGMLVEKEGIPCDPGFDVDPPAYLFNEHEDPTGTPHPDSVHQLFCETYIEDLCREQCGDQRFIFASAEDYCIKEFTPDTYYREQMIDYGWAYDCLEHIPALYSQDGYTSMLQGRLEKFGVEDEKLINSGRIDYSAEDQTTPGVLYMQAAYAAQPSCRAWTTPRSHTIECQTELSNSEHSTAGSRHSDSPEYHFYSAGVYLGWRFYVTSTGSPVTFNGLHIKVRRKQGNW